MRIDKQKIKEWAGALRVIIIECLILAAIVAAVTIYIYLKYPDFIQNFRSAGAFNAFMSAHEGESYALYISLQALQVVISVIPGQIVQIAGGYLYGFWMASLLSLIGIAAGSAAAFLLARFLGRGPVKALAGEKTLKQAEQLLDSKYMYRTMFFLYLIPGFPKDALAYIAGLSGMSFWSFILMATLVRFPAMAASMLIGSLAGTGSYVSSVIVAAVCVVMFAVCVIFRKKIMTWIDRYFYSTGSGAGGKKYKEN